MTHGLCALNESKKGQAAHKTQKLGQEPAMARLACFVTPHIHQPCGGTCGLQPAGEVRPVHPEVALWHSPVPYSLMFRNSVKLKLESYRIQRRW